MLDSMQWSVLAKKSFFAIVIVSMGSRPAGLFSVVQDLLQSGHMGVEGEHSVTLCDAFANYFTGKIDLGRMCRTWMCGGASFLS